MLELGDMRTPLFDIDITVVHDLRKFLRQHPLKKDFRLKILDWLFLLSSCY